MMKSEILRLLKENRGYLSGQQICDHFQVSRTAVWKVIEHLKKEGYQIEAVRNKGYHLVHCPDVMSKAEIESLVHTKWAGTHVVCYEETDSTNIRAKDAGEKGEAHGTLFVAERQAAGKGRRGRSWESPAGVSIYMTILLRPELAPVEAPRLTPLMAIAVVEGIRRVTGLRCQIIGVGVNVNQESFSEEIQEKATSLRLELGRHIRRSEVIAAVMEEFEACYETFLKTGDLAGVKEKYNRMLVNRGREVKILEPGNEYEAHALGINNDGELIVRTKDGQEHAIYAGEVSVRGVYGYV